MTFDRDIDTAMVWVYVWDAQGTLVATAEVPAGDRTQVELPDSDGDYMVTIREQDEDGNWDDSTGTPIVLNRSATIDPDPTRPDQHGAGHPPVSFVTIGGVGVGAATVAAAPAPAPRAARG